MGTEKALLKLDGETLADRALRKLRQVCAEVAIAGARGEILRLAQHSVRVISDLLPECGPLGGIVSALEHTAFEWNLFLAVDVPFVPVEALVALLEEHAGGAQSIIIPEVDGQLHPLCGVYARSALPALRAELKAGHYKVVNAIRKTGSWRAVPWQNPGWVHNLNTPHDLRSATLV